LYNPNNQTTVVVVGTSVVGRFYFENGFFIRKTIFFLQFERKQLQPKYKILFLIWLLNGDIFPKENISFFPKAFSKIIEKDATMKA